MKEELHNHIETSETTAMLSWDARCKECSSGRGHSFKEIFNREIPTFANPMNHNKEEEKFQPLKPLPDTHPKISPLPDTHPSVPQENSWESEFEKAWIFGIDDKQKKANMKYLFEGSLQKAREEGRQERMRLCENHQENARKEGYNQAINDALGLLPEKLLEVGVSVEGYNSKVFYNRAIERVRENLSKLIK